jgi:hypothetical protein
MPRDGDGESIARQQGHQGYMAEWSKALAPTTRVHDIYLTIIKPLKSRQRMVKRSLRLTASIVQMMNTYTLMLMYIRE